MARCWSCGAEIPGGWRYWITCPACSQAEDVKRIRRRLESSGVESLSVAVGILEVSGQLVNIASILEWGFEEIGWKLDQIGGTLKSIDKTLKTPSMTQANEWRQIAEELRQRGVLDESKRFFLKSIDTNPLDYRTYISLGKNELQLGKLDEAKTLWEKSLPHAPKGLIDYKSYSYRLIGRIYFCQENYQQAASALKTAIELSPNYWLGHYDYAQYCALINDKDNCLKSLEIALIHEPIPIKLVRKEENFKLLEREIEDLWTAMPELMPIEEVRRKVEERRRKANLPGSDEEWEKALEPLLAEDTLTSWKIEEIEFKSGLKKFGHEIVYKIEYADKELESITRAPGFRGSESDAVYYALRVVHFRKEAKKIVREKSTPISKKADRVKELAQCMIYWALRGKEELGMQINKAEKERNTCSL